MAKTGHSAGLSAADTPVRVVPARARIDRGATAAPRRRQTARLLQTGVRLTYAILGETKRRVLRCPVAKQASTETQAKQAIETQVGSALAHTACPKVVVCGLSAHVVGARSFELFGAFFPAWLLCGLVGIACAIAARVLFVKTGLARTVPFQLAVCTALGSATALLVWMGCFL